MGSFGTLPVKNSQSTARLSANSAADPAKTRRIISPSPQILRTTEPRRTKSVTAPPLSQLGSILYTEKYSANVGDQEGQEVFSTASRPSWSSSLPVSCEENRPLDSY